MTPLAIDPHGRFDPLRRAAARTALAAALLSLGAAASPAQTGRPEAELVAVSEPCLNLRPGPSLSDAPVRCLPPGRRMTLLESRGEWGRVRLPDDQVGWVALSLVKPAGEGASAPVPSPPRSGPRPVEPRPAEPPRQPEPPATAPEPETGAQSSASMTALAEAEAASRRRVRELEAALVAADAENRELERALAAVIEDDAESTAAAEADWRAEVDDLTGLLRAAEMFLSESEKQRLELARQVAALQRENQALRERLGEPPAVVPSPVAEAGDADTAVLLPEAPIADAAAEPVGEVAAPEVVPPGTPVADPEERTGGLESAAATPEIVPAAAPAEEASKTAVDPAGDAAPTSIAPAETPIVEAPEAEPEAIEVPEAATDASPETPAAPPAPAPEPEEPETSDLVNTVTAWARAWSEQRVEDYLAFYAAGFQPPGGMSRAAWEGQRRERVSGPSRIHVKVALRDVRVQSPDRVEIELLQSYESDSHSDVVVKTLELVLEAGGWKIARERSGS